MTAWGAIRAVGASRTSLRPLVREQRTGWPCGQRETRTGTHNADAQGALLQGRAAAWPAQGEQ